MSDKETFYCELVKLTDAIICDESDIIANMANISALLFDRLSNVNWVGFYRLIDNELVLGPFQGKVACIRIPVGKGVCGTCVSSGEVQRVNDVHQFDGHIACDAASNAELVLPINVAGKIVAILDIDSTVHGRFTEEDEQGMKLIVKALEHNIANLIKT
jgi:GAF domain-containing protein